MKKALNQWVKGLWWSVLVGDRQAKAKNLSNGAWAYGGLLWWAIA
jgi:hypothetical protein